MIWAVLHLLYFYRSDIDDYEPVRTQNELPQYASVDRSKKVSILYKVLACFELGRLLWCCNTGVALLMKVYQINTYMKLLGRWDMRNIVAVLL